MIKKTIPFHTSTSNAPSGVQRPECPFLYHSCPPQACGGLSPPWRPAWLVASRTAWFSPEPPTPGRALASCSAHRRHPLGLDPPPPPRLAPAQDQASAQVSSLVSAHKGAALQGKEPPGTHLMPQTFGVKTGHNNVWTGPKQPCVPETYLQG